MRSAIGMIPIEAEYDSQTGDLVKVTLDFRGFNPVAVFDDAPQPEAAEELPGVWPWRPLDEEGWVEGDLVGH